MPDSKIKLGTFRIPENTWKDFLAKARSNGDNASSILLNTVHAYLNNQETSALNSASITTATPTIALSSPSSTPASDSPTSTTTGTIANSSTPSILLAISPDNQILYIDRSFGIPQPQHWNPPHHLRNANPHFRLEFITASDSSILAPIENALVNTFKPTFNFQRIDQDFGEYLHSITNSIPLHLLDRILSLLNNGFSPEDIHHALNTLHFHSHSHSNKSQIPEQNKNHNDLNLNLNTSQITEAIATFTSIADRITAIEQRLLDADAATSQKPTITEKQEDKDNQTISTSAPSAPLSKSSSSRANLNQPLKGTASAEELPQPLGTTELALRLNITVKRLEKTRTLYKNSPQKFFRYTFNKENRLFGWIYDPTQQLHIPHLEFTTLANITEDSQPTTATAEPTPKPLPEKSSNKSKPTSTKKPEPLPNLTLIQSQLAKRFGISSSTLSRKRTALSNGYISAQDFNSWCRTLDPDNFTWTYSEQYQHYTSNP